MFKTTHLHAGEKFFAILVYTDPGADESEGALAVRSPDFDDLAELRMFVGAALSDPTPYSSAVLKKYTDLELSEIE
jgi:hypothetical protein